MEFADQIFQSLELNKRIEETHLLSLHFLFQDNFEKALVLFENKSVSYHYVKNSPLGFFQVVGLLFNDFPFNLQRCVFIRKSTIPIHGVWNPLFLSSIQINRNDVF